MSVHVSSWAWRQVVGDAAAKLLLMKLADNANDDGVCWPSRRTLSEETELSPRTLVRKAEYLRDRGLLTFQRRWQKSTVYSLQINKGANLAQLSESTPTRNLSRGDS